MTENHKVDVQPSTQEIENSVHENGGIITSFGYGYACPGNCPDRVGDWQVRLVDKRGMGNHGSFIAVAASLATLKLQKRATMRLLRKKADAMAARSRLPDNQGLPYSDVKASKDHGHYGQQNQLELEARRSFRERGDFACELVPLLFSQEFERRGVFIFADDAWAYFAHSHGNYLRVGDDRYRLWVRPAGRR